jgi:hypothetical protein
MSKKKCYLIHRLLWGGLHHASEYRVGWNIEAIKYFSIDKTNIIKPKLSVDIGSSRSDFEHEDRPLAEYGVDGPTLSDICKSDDGINLRLWYQLRVGEILELEKNYICDVWIEQR